MLPYLIWVLIALLAAAAVVLVASAARERQGASFLTDLRSGWAARRHPDPEQRAAAKAAHVEPVDVPLDEFLAATTHDDHDGYLQVDEVKETLLKARDRAVQGVPRSMPRMRTGTRRADQDVSGH